LKEKVLEVGRTLSKLCGSFSLFSYHPFLIKKSRTLDFLKTSSISQLNRLFFVKDTTPCCQCVSFARLLLHLIRL